MRMFKKASPAPRRLMYLATFNSSERRRISSSNELKNAITAENSAKWIDIISGSRAAGRQAAAARGDQVPDKAGMRDQAHFDLIEASRRYARLADGRRNELFRIAAALGRYVANGVLSEAELYQTLSDAATENGALPDHGWDWFNDCVQRALSLAQNDPLPPLARQFRRGDSRL